MGGIRPQQSGSDQIILGPTDAVGDLRQPLLGKIQLLPCEVHVAHGINRYQVQVRMRNLQTDDGHTYTIAGTSTLDAYGDLLREWHHVRQDVNRQIEEPIHFDFRHDERVTLSKRMDVEECQETFILPDLVAGNLTIDDACEDAGHGQRLISMISNRVVPAGVATSATSPRALPSNPFPMGEVTLIFPVRTSASLSATIVNSR